MGELAREFGGKIDGQMIRADDWNKLIDGIEAQFDGLRSELGDRLDGVEGRLEVAETNLTNAQEQIDALNDLATTVRSRYRQLRLSTARNSFAIGERAEIVANVTNFDGSPLDLSSAATRPWVDFVTVWGSLKAAPGFTSRVGTGGKTVSVQVNASGEARAMLREETGQIFAEEEELEIAAVLDTTVGSARVADMFLGASTPAATDLVQAYATVTTAYELQETAVMRNYLDGIYLRNPSRSYTPLAPTFTLNWQDEYATVMAFVKPDDNPGTSDSAMAAGSIRVTFRDWVYPWIIGHYLPPPPPLITDYVGIYTPLFELEAEPAVNGIFDHVQEQAFFTGILGQQRNYAAAVAAIQSIPAVGEPTDFRRIAENAVGGLKVQQSMIYSAAISPGDTDVTAPARAVAGAGIRGEAAAQSVAGTVRAETTAAVALAETRILEDVAARNVKFENDLLAPSGPVGQATVAIDAASLKIDEVSTLLGQKANIDLVGQLLSVRGIE